jgi:uncharacterized membrane protein YdfJ with MMPL/SSD domain
LPLSAGGSTLLPGSRRREHVATDRLNAATGGREDAWLVALVTFGGDVRTDPAARAKVRAIQRTIDADPGVLIARSYIDTRSPAFVSRDGRQTIVVGAFRDGIEELDVADRLRAKLGGEGVKLGGPDVVGPEIGEQVSSDLARAELIAFPLLFLLSPWVFRSLVAALLPPLIGALSIVATFLLMRLVNGELTSLSIYALNLVTGIGLGLAIDLFMVSRYREELALGGDGASAIARTLRTAGRTVLFSSLTVAAALASLLVFPMRFLYSMGIGGVLVALIAMVVSLTVLPAILVALGPRVNAGSPRFLRRAAETSARPATSGGWYRLAHFVMRRPGPVALVTPGALLIAGLPFLRIEFVPVDFKMLPEGSEARQVSAAIDRNFAAFAAQPIQAVASAPPARDAEVARYAAALRRMAGSGSVSAPRRLSRDTVLVDVLPPGDAISERNRAVMRDVRRVPAPVPVVVGGEAARFVDQQNTLADYLPIALGLLDSRRSRSCSC